MRTMRPMMRQVLGLATAAVLTLGAATAGAQPSWRDKAEAKQLYRQGKFLVRKGDFEAAAEKFQAADEKDPQPSYKLELARMLVEKGAFAEATSTLEACSALEPKQWAEKNAQKKCGTFADEVNERSPKLGVQIFEPEASLVTVTVDGDTVDPGDGPFALDPGEHEVEAEAEGYESFSKKVQLEESKTETVEITLQKSAASLGDDGGKKGGGGGLSPIPAYVAWGVGAVGLGLGIGFGVSAIQTTNQVLRDYGCEDNACPAEAEDDLNTAKLNGNISTAGFVIGFTGVVAGTVLFLFSGDDEDEPKEGVEAEAVVVQPMIGPGYLGLQGQF